MIEQLKALNRYQRTIRSVKHVASPHFTDTAEILTTQPHLLSTEILRELQDAHNPEHFADVDNELEGLSICTQDQNSDYDCEMHTDTAARWLQMANLCT